MLVPATRLQAAAQDATLAVPQAQAQAAVPQQQQPVATAAAAAEQQQQQAAAAQQASGAQAAAGAGAAAAQQPAGGTAAAQQQPAAASVDELPSAGGKTVDDLFLCPDKLANATMLEQLPQLKIEQMLDSSKPRSPQDVTLVTQLSFERCAPSGDGGPCWHGATSVLRPAPLTCPPPQNPALPACGLSRLRCCRCTSCPAGPTTPRWPPCLA